MSLVAVAFRSAAELPVAVESFRAETLAAGATAEVVVVDHSENPAEHDRLGVARPDVLVARPNRGYAAGLNAGIERATGEVLFLANPDLRFLEGSVGALLAALGDGADLVGPQFELSGFSFAPAEPQTVLAERRKARAGKSPSAWFRALRREVARCRRVWEAEGPVAVPQLSGALIACRPETARAIGPWDEDFFLYFEETDWIDRASRAGYTVRIAPGARVEHRWGHAAAPAESGEIYARSRQRYFERRGPLGRRAARWRFGSVPFALAELPALRQREVGDAWWLASPAPLGMPAGGLRSSEAPFEPLSALHRACPEPMDLVITAVATADNTVAGAWLSRSPGSA
ncbi:MAG: glycosyltransferase family 2 protein [Acidobacteriota bacterium]